MFDHVCVCVLGGSIYYSHNNSILLSWFMYQNTSNMSPMLSFIGHACQDTKSLIQSNMGLECLFDCV